MFPLLPARAEPSDGFLRPSYSQGLEQEIAILFADMRSFTKFSEHRLPYDVEATMAKIRAIPELPDYLAERLAVGR